jgi:uncharacterized caspase-like protein
LRRRSRGARCLLWTATSFAILTNSAATKTAIRKTLTNLANKAVSGDTVVYYHSSHGGNNDTDLPSVYLYTYDAHYTDSELAEDLSLFRSGVKLVVAADTCNSGGLFTEDPTTQSRTLQARAPEKPVRPDWDLAGRVTERMKAARAASAKSARAAASAIDPDQIGWLTAAAYYEYSYEEPIVGHGWFTYGLLTAFVWGDTDGNGNLDFKEMFDFAACRVPYCDQTPQAGNSDAPAAAVAASSFPKGAPSSSPRFPARPTTATPTSTSRKASSP